MTTHYDLIVIGAGPAGNTCAERVNAAGRSVALIECDAMGGTCLNYGCDPTKTALHLTNLLKDIDQARGNGLLADEISAEWSALVAHIDAVQTEMRGGTQEESRQGTRERGIDLIDGMAQFVSAEIVRADEREFTADHILIATGTEPLVPEIPGLKQLGYQTNRTIFEMPFVPERLAIVGGGPVGVEFAQMFRRLGAQVTLIEMTPHILPKDDPELAAELQKLLEAEGIEVKTQAKVSAVGPDPNGKRLTIQYENAYEETLLVDEILLASGRKPVIEPLNLDQAAIATEDGQIKVDDHLHTNVNHIWAAGDVANDYPFTHTAWRQGAYIAQQILGETDAPLDLGPVPWVTYTDPELANVGKTESQLKEEGIEYRVASYKVGDVARAVITGDTEGRVKLLIGNDDRILGGHILATNASDLIGSVITAMHGNLSASILAEAVWPYPTFSEAIGNAAASAFEKTLA